MKRMDSLILVYGGQWGSEGKGQVLAAIVRDSTLATEDYSPLHGYGVRVGGPNAGHTVRAASGELVKIQSIPSMCFAYPDAIAPVIGAGGLINPEVLSREIELLKTQGYPGSVIVDPNAMMVLPRHIQQEHDGKLQEHIGSTREGVGAALAEKIRRGPNVITAKSWPSFPDGVVIQDTVRLLNASDRPVYVEGTQGYLLSMNTSGYYPFVTSRECGPEGILADIGLTTRAFALYQIVCVLRTFPIRVGGNSGDLPYEVDWDYMAECHNVAVPERTTVTNRVRRIALWSYDIAEQVVRETRPTCLAITFLDYLFPETSNATSQEGLSEKAMDWLKTIEDITQVEVRYVSAGQGQEHTFRISTGYIPF